MADNTIKTENGVEVYKNNIDILVDRYIQEELNGDDSNIKNKFKHMMYYIQDRLNKPDTDDINLLDDIFNIFIRLCAKYDILPTLSLFSAMSGINACTLSRWLNDKARTNTNYSQFVKNWKDTCRDAAIDALTNKPGANANLIFVSKAVYGLQETAPAQPHQLQLAPAESAEEIAERARLTAPERPELPPDL